MKRYNTKDELVESLTREPAWPSAVSDVLFDFVANINNHAITRQECISGLETMSIIESVYKSIEMKAPVNPRGMG